MQILHNSSQRQVRELDYLSIYISSVLGVKYFETLLLYMSRVYLRDLSPKRLLIFFKYLHASSAINTHWVTKHRMYELYDIGEAWEAPAWLKSFLHKMAGTPLWRNVGVKNLVETLMNASHTPLDVPI